MNTTPHNKLQTIYIVSLIAIFGALSFTVLSKFLIVLALSYVFAILLNPAYLKIQSFLERKKIFAKASQTIGSAITVLLLLVLIITPFSLILGKILVDAQDFYTQVSTSGFQIDTLSTKIQDLTNRFSPNLSLQIDQIVKTVSGFIVQNVGGLFSGTIDIVLKMVLFLIGLFYFLKDGARFKALYTRVSPLENSEDVTIHSAVQIAVKSIVIGSLTVAVCQGIATGIGFAIFGVPNPFFWGSVAGLFALVPGIGATLVWFPAVVYLYFTGDGSLFWLGQLIWGVVAVGLLDNVLGPVLMNKGVRIHPLFILLSVLGGISIFGPEGLLFGPLVLSIFVALTSVWRARINA